MRIPLSLYLPLHLSSGRTCPWPPPIEQNYMAQLLSPTHTFSALLEVSCYPGFTLPNGMDVIIRRCQGDRQWSGDEPICTGVFELSEEKTKTYSYSLLFLFKNQEHIQQLMHTWNDAAAVFVVSLLV